MPSSLVLLLRAEQTMAARWSLRPALGGVSGLPSHVRWESAWECAYLTMPAMFSANLPTLVPPNLSTTQPPGRCFSSVCAIRSDECLYPFVVVDMAAVLSFSRPVIYSSNIMWYRCGSDADADQLSVSKSNV